MIMIKNRAIALIIFVCISLVCAGPVTAAINTISQGNIVFIGEQGLDISAAMGPDTGIGWWASAADIMTTSPTNSIDLTNRITGFMVTPSEFSGYTGNWYRLNSEGKADGIAFNVAEPRLDIKAEDTTVQVDVEALKWIPTGDDIQFRIDNNLAPMASQRGSPPLITIKVQGPDGGIYSAVYNAGGVPTSIVDIPVTSTRYYTGTIWNMGDPARYSPGTYTIWAECNVNKMNDNYDVTGKTISRKITLLNQGVNPLITKKVTTPTPTTAVQTATQAITTASTPAFVTTTITTPAPTEPLTTTTTAVPSPTRTKAQGFGTIMAVTAISLGLVFYLKKE
jgi:hypothetical protein